MCVPNESHPRGESGEGLEDQLFGLPQSIRNHTHTRSRKDAFSIKKWPNFATREHLPGYPGDSTPVFGEKGGLEGGFEGSARVVH